MSPREKRLILFFAVAGFIVINFLAIRLYRDQRLKVDNAQTLAKQQLEIAQNFSASREQVMDQMEWLSQHEPAAAANQDIQTQLQQASEREAKATGLIIKTQKPLPTDATADRHYHRAKLQITVSGSEQALYQWLDRINMPDQLRIASKINLKPNDQDDTKIDCTATVEQWFVPTPSA